MFCFIWTNILRCCPLDWQALELTWFITRKWLLVTCPVSHVSPQLSSDHRSMGLLRDLVTPRQTEGADHWCARIVFPDQQSKNRSYVFTIYNPSNSCKNNEQKKVSGGREKDNVASCSVREYRIKIQVLWFRSISWRRWLFPCIINRRYWIDISRPAEIRFLIQLFIIHSLTELYTGQQPSHNCLLYPPLPGTPTETGVVRFNNPPVFKLHHPSFHPPSLFPCFY